VNAAPVPSSRDTALTIAADKGHYKFVELILRCGAHVDVKNKKGNSPLWLACNGEDSSIPFIENQCIELCILCLSPFTRKSPKQFEDKANNASQLSSLR